MEQANNASAIQIRTNRGLAKFFFLSLITFGIYGIVVMTHISEDINTIANKYDGKHTTNYLLVFFILDAVSLGIASFVWLHKLSDRIGDELYRRKQSYYFSSATFWLWCVLGSLLLGIGPLIYIYKLMHSMNCLAADYNRVG